MADVPRRTSLARCHRFPLPDHLKLLWTFKTAGPVKSSAAISGNQAVIGSNDGYIYALDLAHGQKLWSFKTAGPVESSPLITDGKVFAGSTDAFLYALDATTGKLLWKYETGDKILGSPNSIKSHGETWILIGSYDFKLHCVNAATGKAVWTYESGNYINGSPAVADGKTAFGGCDAMLHILSLADGKEIKEVEAGAYVAGSVALADGRAYFGHWRKKCEFRSASISPREKSNGTFVTVTFRTSPLRRCSRTGSSLAVATNSFIASTARMAKASGLFPRAGKWTVRLSYAATRWWSALTMVASIWFPWTRERSFGPTKSASPWRVPPPWRTEDS